LNFANAIWHPRGYSGGVPIGSDWADKPEGDPKFGLYKNCGFWSRGEVALLGQVARQFPGRWLEIGSHTGWCAGHLVASGCDVISIDPGFLDEEWYERFRANLAEELAGVRVIPFAGRSAEFFNIWELHPEKMCTGSLIDGDHDAPNPLEDAKGSYARLADRGVIALHDFRGPAVWDAAKWLVDQGMQFRVYPSVHMVCLCWRGSFDPPPDIQEGPDWRRIYEVPAWVR
jgi:hypothetical protein